ncbi:Protein RALF-like 1 [Forsythia ovata]|uniref:Protein RALF-like 1 n=1 Tax=Forsythia ovata TaxID=205694 RepID=A0ABD1UYP0_9LAMI
MPKTHLSLCTHFLILVLLFLVKFCNGVSILDLNLTKTGEMGKRVCEGKINECPEMAVEEEIDSETNRRVLVMQKKYISYDTLKRDSVPCTQPGASYYNCRGPGVANTYNRGCEMITRCRGD